MAANTKIDVIRLDSSAREDVVDVLCEAFYDYPVMQHIADGLSDDYVARLRALIGFYVDLRFIRQWPVLGVYDNLDVVAVALVNEPVDAAWIEESSGVIDTLHDCLGESAYQRMVEFEQASSESEPDFPHYFLGMIGVLNGSRGKGYAYHLMQHVVGLSESDKRSRAVALTTESEKNIAYYQRFGFQLVSETKVGNFISRGFVFPTEC